MNFLAHMVLSNRYPAVLCGNVVTDWLTKKEALLLPDTMLPGVYLHYFIDNYTDNHSVVQELVLKTLPMFGKITPVVLDIYFDHLLLLQWNDFYKEPFAHFEAFAYDSLKSCLNELPNKIQGRLQNMIDEKWLRVYLNRDDLQYIFKRLAIRVPVFAPVLEHAHLRLEENRDWIAPYFAEFFPDIIVASAKKLQSLLTHDPNHL